MISSELSIKIRRPMAEVFAYLMDVSNYLVWQSGLLAVSASDGMRAGSDITFTTVGMGRKFKLVATVVENDQVSSFRVVSARGPITFDSSYHLSPDDDGTIVKLVNNINAGTVFRLAEPVLQSISDSRYEADLHALKAILESPAEVPAT